MGKRSINCDEMTEGGRTEGKKKEKNQHVKEVLKKLGTNGIPLALYVLYIHLFSIQACLNLWRYRQSRSGRHLTCQRIKKV